MTWKQIIEEEQVKPYYESLRKTLDTLYLTGSCYPHKDDVFKALKLCPFDNVKVVILGQDPYYNGNADGLAFSCKSSLSPSLKAIKESLIEDNLSINDKPTQLDEWAKQGVLLLNICLTVAKETWFNGEKVGGAKSHYNIGWEKFTGRVLEELLRDESPKVFLIWGKEAAQHFKLNMLGILTLGKHLIIYGEHPAFAAYARKSWDNQNCFNKANKFLEDKLKVPINWVKVFD